MDDFFAAQVTPPIGGFFLNPARQSTDCTHSRINAFNPANSSSENLRLRGFCSSLAFFADQAGDHVKIEGGGFAPAKVLQGDGSHHGVVGAEFQRGDE